MLPFKFYWKNFNALAGFKFVLGVLIVYLVSKRIDFPMLLAGLSALFAWLIVLLGKSKNPVRMVGLYLILGLILTWISNLLASTYWPWLILFFIVIFTGTLLLRAGKDWFMMGWSLIYWLLLSPSFRRTFEANEMHYGYLVGCGSVLILVILEQIWRKIWGKNFEDREVRNNEEEVSIMPWGEISQYALIVSITIVCAMIIGYFWLKSDPTMIANAAFMIIGFSTINTWKAGLERMLASLLAILLGFALGYYMQSEVFGIVFYLLTSFLVLSMIEVNNGAVVFFFLVSVAYGWGMLDYDIGSVQANERLFAEFIGVILAGIAITLLNENNRLKPRIKKMKLFSTRKK